jgi:propionyl-CoA carboxylase alpha chain
MYSHQPFSSHTGVTHNIAILYDVLSHPRFLSGNLSTKFLAEEYPGGFKCRKVSEIELNELCAAAVFAYVRREFGHSTTTKWASNQVPMGIMLENDLVVGIHGNEYKVHVHTNIGLNELILMINGKKMRVKGIWDLNVPLMNLTVDDRPIVIQYINRSPLGCRLQHHGTQFDISVMTTSQSTLSKYMIAKPKIDKTRWILAPMPGIVVSLAVKEGDQVNDNPLFGSSLWRKINDGFRNLRI